MISRSNLPVPMPDPDDDQPRTQAERDEFQQCLTEIHCAGTRYITMRGNAIGVIHDKKLWREDFASWTEFCQSERGLGKSTNWAYDLIRAARVINSLSSIGDKGLLPSSTDQAIALARIKDPAQRQRVFERAVEIADGRPLTTGMIEQACEELWTGRPGERTSGRVVPRSGGYPRKDAGWPCTQRVVHGSRRSEHSSHGETHYDLGRQVEGAIEAVPDEPTGSSDEPGMPTGLLGILPTLELPAVGIPSSASHAILQIPRDARQAPQALRNAFNPADLGEIELGLLRGDLVDTLIAVVNVGKAAGGKQCPPPHRPAFGELFTDRLPRPSSLTSGFRDSIAVLRLHSDHTGEQWYVWAGVPRADRGPEEWELEVLEVENHGQMYCTRFLSELRYFPNGRERGLKLDAEFTPTPFPHLRPPWPRRPVPIPEIQPP